MIMMNNIFIFDDVLTLEEQHAIDAKFHSNKIDWYYNSSTVNYSNSDSLVACDNIKESVQFTHVLLSDQGYESNLINIGKEILEKFLKKHPVEFEKILRIKANLMPQVSAYNNEFHTTPHVDTISAHWVLLYYVNDTDGDTLIFDNSDKLTLLMRVQPKKGKFVLFPGHLFHAGQFPVHSSTRVLLNFNLTI